MAQAVSEVPTCEWATEEAAFVGAIDFSLVRDAVFHGMDAKTLLTILLQPMKGLLPLHLNRVPPYPCRGRMVAQLDSRMARVRNNYCPSWRQLLMLAVDPASRDGHVERCPFCKRDIRQIRGNMPYFREFDDG